MGVNSRLVLEVKMNGRKIQKHCLWVVMVVLCVCIPDVSATTFDCFDDGKVHEINYNIIQHAVIKDSPTGNSTTVILLPGGSIEEDLSSYGNSLFIQSGGTVGRDLKIFNSSHIDISEGLIGRDFLVYNDSEIKISGGTIGGKLISCNNSQLTITGGSRLRSIEVYNQSQVILSGGSTAENIMTNDDSYVFVSGGFIDGMLNPKHNSQITVYGTGFNYPRLGYIADTSGTLTGTLANGNPIDTTFVRDGNGAILLVSAIKADLNLDGIVDFIDFALFASQWKNTDCAVHNNCKGADFEPDGDVDLEDLAEFANNWLEVINL
jgi:hypothetical protein